MVQPTTFPFHDSAKATHTQENVDVSWASNTQHSIFSHCGVAAAREIHSSPAVTGETTNTPSPEALHCWARTASGFPAGSGLPETQSCYEQSVRSRNLRVNQKSLWTAPAPKLLPLQNHGEKLQICWPFFPCPSKNPTPTFSLQIV